jgi:hypothetical protein
MSESQLREEICRLGCICILPRHDKLRRQTREQAGELRKKYSG